MIQQQQQQSSFKKTSTPSSKRKIATVLDLENVENVAHQSIGSPSKAAAVSLSSPTINSAPPLMTVKKAFTGANVTGASLNNHANIINNQQPKVRIANAKVDNPKSVPVTSPSEVEPQLKSGKTVLPQAVARRNARERNRVKQVNNGFAALRQHIPEEMAEAFELQKGSSATASATAAAAANANAQKKLSKVETLRMAVEYIRNLESLLNISSSQHANDHSFSFCDTSSIVSNSPSSPSFSNSSMIDEEPSLHPQSTHPLLSYDCDSLPIDQSHIVLPSVTTINGIPYLRLPPNQGRIGQGFLGGGATDSGDFILVSTDGSGDGDHQMQQEQQQLLYPTGMDHQPIILYAPATTSSPAAAENNFQSNFVNNNLLAPAYLQGGGRVAEEFNSNNNDDDDDECSGQSTTAARSPVPVNVDGDRIKIEQQPSHGGVGRGSNCPSSTAYVNKSPLIRHVDLERQRRRLHAEESPPKRLCTGNEQFSVVDQSGVIIRGSFIEIKQEQQAHPEPQFNVDRTSPEILGTSAESMYDNVHDRLLHLKTEIGDEETDRLSLLDSEITEEHMLDAMEWWENEKRSASN